MANTAQMAGNIEVHINIDSFTQNSFL